MCNRSQNCSHNLTSFVYITNIIKLKYLPNISVYSSQDSDETRMSLVACIQDMVVDGGPDLKLEPLVFKLITDSFSNWIYDFNSQPTSIS